MTERRARPTVWRRDVAMERWEYMTFDFTKPKRDTEGLNRLGDEGWEAVAMVSTWGVSEMRFVHPMVLLKRALPERAAADPPSLVAT
jgi:hypothetical protein